MVGVQLNTIVEARPAKIIAGLEPENTNRFLQLLGSVPACLLRPDRKRAHTRAVGGGVRSVEAALTTAIPLQLRTVWTGCGAAP